MTWRLELSQSAKKECNGTRALRGTRVQREEKGAMNKEKQAERTGEIQLMELTASCALRPHTF